MIEKPFLTLGFVPLTDSAPLIVAHEQGFFRDEGLAVRLSCEPSWASVRDKLNFGDIDGASLLATLPLVSRLVPQSLSVPLTTALVLSRNGNAITVSEALHREMTDADPVCGDDPTRAALALAAVVQARKRAGRSRLRLASVFPMSTHGILLRYWLAASGIDPLSDISLRVVPPPLMTAHLEAGRLDGYCVGEPWSSLAVHKGLGRIVATGFDVWNHAPEKVFAVTAAWAANHPNTHRALLRALLKAGRWLDDPLNRLHASALLTGGGYLDVPERVVAAALTGNLQTAPSGHRRSHPHMLAFHRGQANMPWRSQGLWYGLQLQRWGDVSMNADLRCAAMACMDTALYRHACADLGLPVPETDWKTEGTGPADHCDGGRFCDGRLFDPDDVDAYRQRQGWPSTRAAG